MSLFGHYYIYEIVTKERKKTQRPALSPLEACLALMPTSGAQYLPAAYRPLLQDKGSELQAILSNADRTPLEPRQYVS
jgi:hypothetical protein